MLGEAVGLRQLFTALSQQRRRLKFEQLTIE